MKNKAKKIAFMGIMASLAIVLSYVEAMLPPLSASVPGIKMGLANIVIVFALYSFGVGSAVCISLVRLFAVALLFGNATTFAYSFAGAALSLTLMYLLKRFDILSPVGVSTAGGVSHNIAQIAVAILLLGRAEIGYYLIVLTLTGTVSGVLIGLLGSLLIKRLKHKIN